MPKTDSGKRRTAAPHEGQPSPYRIQVLDRAVRVLDVLAEANEELGAPDLVLRLSLQKSTVHRLLTVLEHHRFIQRSPTLGKYSLGMKLFELGTCAIGRVKLRDRVEPFLRRLVDATKETAHVCIPTGTDVLSIANVEGPWKLRSPSTVGRRTPMHCTSTGKAIMAFLPEPDLGDLIGRMRLKRYTRKTLATHAALRAELVRIRQRGYAIDDEETEEGLRCVGAPIRDSAGRVVAAISVVGPVFRLKTERLPACARVVMAAACELSQDLGYQKPRLQRSV